MIRQTMQMIIVRNKSDYFELVNKGFEPLIDWTFFTMPIDLRLSLQSELFGQYELSRGNIEAGNHKFYKWIWSKKYHICEETNQPLKNYSSVHVSHILSRGAFPEMALDPRNINLLIFDKHQQWETGIRTTMRIYRINQIVINLLKKDYGRF